MGLTLSLVAPTLSDSKSQLTSESEATGPKTMQSKTADKTTDNNTTIKYLSKHGPPTVLGPTPGNVPSPNPIVGVPIIHPPKDTTTKAPDNSLYDTLQMTPDVDWSKKKMLKAPIDKK